MSASYNHLGKTYSGEPVIISIKLSSKIDGTLGNLIFSLLRLPLRCHIILRINNITCTNIIPNDIKLLCTTNLIEIQFNENACNTIEPGICYNEIYQCPELFLPDNIAYPTNMLIDMIELALKYSPRKKVDVIISLTTWKGRIFHSQFPDNLLSLLKQNTSFNYKVVLVLSSDEFGKNFDLPESIKKIQTQYENFEILWTERNTKALKNYNPTAQKYKYTPIIVLGDDTIYKNTLVQTVFTTFLSTDRKCCLGFYISESSPKYNILSPFRIRLFPPNCMFDLDEKYFEEYFHGHNDLFNGLRLILAHTKVIRGNWPILWEHAFAQDVRLIEYHTIPEETIIDTFLNEHSDIKQLLETR